MDSLIKNAPEIIAKASQSTLGILALMILVMGVLAFLFFRGAQVLVRVGIFVLTFAAVVAFGAAVIRQIPDNGPSRGEKPARADIDGQWKGQHEAMTLEQMRGYFRYVYLPPADLLFTLRSDGDAVHGKVTVAKNDAVYNSQDLDYGLLEGHLDGAKVSFQVKAEVAVNGTPAVNVDRFDGTVDGDKIHFWVQEDSGYPPLEFTAIKVGP